MKRQGEEDGESTGKKRADKKKIGTLRKTIEEEWLPLALMAGVGREELGRLTPAGLAPYIKAYELRRKTRLEEINFQCWLTGIYFTHSMACAFSQGSSYPEAPFELFAEQISEEEKSKKAAELFSAYVCEFNSQMKKEGR